MSADRGRTTRTGRDSGSSGSKKDTSQGSRKRSSDSADAPNAVSTRRQLAVRSTAFAVVAIALTMTALWFVVSALHGGSGESHVVLTAGVRYTVRVAELRADERESAEKMIQNPVLRSLAGENELFLRVSADGSLALCAGIFSAKDAPDARELMARFNNYELRGEHVFGSAHVWALEPDASP
jgi:hypothetical protein